MSIAGPLDKELAVPLYHQLQGVLKAEIESGRWRPGEQIPTESTMAENFGVSKITVRQALQELVELGYIRREHGRGTFVSQRKFRRRTSRTQQFYGRNERAQTHGILAHLVSGRRKGRRARSRGVEPARAFAGLHSQARAAVRMASSLTVR